MSDLKCRVLEYGALNVASLNAVTRQSINQLENKMSMSKLPLAANIVLEQEYSPVKQIEEGEVDRIKDPREHCCCNKVHVEIASKSIAILAICTYTLLLLTILAVDFVVNQNYRGNTTALLFNFGVITLSQSIYWCILIAQRKRIPRLYLPYLVVNALNIIFGVGGLVVMSGLLVKPEYYSNNVVPYSILYALCLLNFLYNIWSEWVVYAAFQSMHRQNRQKNRIAKTVTISLGDKNVRPIIMA
uniref:Uncharacterized protein n=1 Tax=Ditylenchus dipsaci TaxID=166011 RepID=A0A915DYD7_9BILA